MARTKIKNWFPISLPIEQYSFFMKFPKLSMETSKRYITRIPFAKVWIPSKTSYCLRKGRWFKEVRSLLPGYALLSFTQKIIEDWTTIEQQIGAVFVRNSSGFVEPIENDIIKNFENEEKIEIWDITNIPSKIGTKVQVKAEAKTYPCAGQVCIFLGVNEIDGGYFASVLYQDREFNIPLDFLGAVINE